MKLKTQTLMTLSVLAALFTQTQSFAAPAQMTSTTDISADNRISRRLGAYLGILGDPHPTVVGVNVAYNLTEYLRASVGFGKVSTSTAVVGSGFSLTTEDQSMTTIGAAAKFLMPNWNLSPAVTVGYSHISLADGMVFSDYKSSNVYLGLGADWQAESGFNLGAGLNLSMNSGAPTAPYINVGMFF
jgi:hypothetical protein